MKNNQFLSNKEYSSFIALSRYARWLPKENRRETWEETVQRYVDFWQNKGMIDTETSKELYDAIYNLEVMPSMRALMTAGDALDRDNVAGFNCSYLAIEGQGPELSVFTDEMKAAGFDEGITIQANKPIAFDELMYILMCGTGVGFSVERQYTASLPVVGHKLPRKMYAKHNANYPNMDMKEISHIDRPSNTIIVQDSKTGWASALRILIVELYNGNFDIDWDVSGVRKEGAPLKVFGGRASGPKPLLNLFNYTKDLFKKANGRKLQSVEAHGLVCKIAEVVVVGGVRRSALISLSNLSDQRMSRAKTGNWWETDVEYALANNSVCYTEKPDIDSYTQEWLNLMISKSGERGLFNRVASQKKAAENGRRDATYAFGTNPCSEIILRSDQFCNLSEIVVRATDTYEDLARKARLATILGTLQSTLTDFRYLNPTWAKNTAEECLLGVSMTGIMDHPILNKSTEIASYEKWEKAYLGDTWHPSTLDDLLDALQKETIKVNKEWANKLGINQSTAITAVKPSGTVSQLVDSASGIHPRFAPFYIRRVRADKKDPLCKMMTDVGFPVEDDFTKPDTTSIFSFPMKAPDDAIYTNDRSAIEQLELWLTYQRHWCEHKPSVTVYVKDDEWLEVGAWVYKHFDEVSGVSFLPYDGGTYQQAPYEEITEDEFNDMTKSMPQNVDWSRLGEWETVDTTVSSHTMACTGSICEIVDI